MGLRANYYSRNYVYRVFWLAFQDSICVLGERAIGASHAHSQGCIAPLEFLTGGSNTTTRNPQPQTPNLFTEQNMVLGF